MPELGYPLSRQQRRAWSVSARAGAGTVEITRSVPAGFDRTSAEQRFAASVERHEALRTVVRIPDGLAEPLQIVDATSQVRLAWETVDGHAVVRLSASPLIADAGTLHQLARVVLGSAQDAEDPIQHAEYAEWQGELAAEAPEGAADFWSALAEPAWTRPAGPGGSADPDGTVGLEGSGAAGHWVALLVGALYRLTGDDDITVGLELDARRGDELLGAAGRYTETAPLAVTVSPDDRAGDLITRCTELAARLADLQEWAPDTLPQDARVLVGAGPADATIRRPGVLLELRRSEDGTAVLIGSGAAQMAAVMAAIGAAPDIALARVDVIAAGLRASELGSAPIDAPESLVRTIADWAARTPDAVAVRARGDQLTYRELVDAIGGLQEQLARAHGDAPIAVLADRSIGAVVGVLAALWSGRGYLPLDPAQPSARLRGLVDDLGCDLVLADGDAQLGGLGPLVGERLTLTRVGAPWPAAAAPDAPGPDSLAYVIYTSGSTGTPKGVEITNANLSAYVAGVRQALRLGDGWNWALATPPSTDLGNTALYGSLATGGTLTVLDDDQVLDPAAFAAVLRSAQIDAVKMTPSHLAGVLVGTDPVVPRRLLVLGGEALPWSLVDRVRTASDVRIVNHYGPTETTVGALVHEVGPDDSRPGASVPIGRPLPGARVRALTAAGALVPLGAAGELSIAGSGVARGYHDDPARTAERFSPDGWYSTGDVVRFRHDGEVEFLGRRDGQVKIRGFRVETGEVEAALLAHPGVQRSAVLLARVDDAAVLAAYVVSHFHPSPTADELRAHLLDRVPAYMVPAAFTELDRLPLTANGKLDVAALPAPDLHANAADQYREPAGMVETEIATIYGELLEHEPVGRDDDFFRLGGHSLLATQAVMRIRQAFALELPIHAIFVAPTVAGLAAEVETLLLADTEFLDPDAEFDDGSDAGTGVGATSADALRDDQR